MPIFGDAYIHLTPGCAVLLWCGHGTMATGTPKFTQISTVGSYQKEATRKKSLKMKTLCRCKKHTDLYGPVTTWFYASPYKVENGNL